MLSRICDMPGMFEGPGMLPLLRDLYVLEDDDDSGRIWLKLLDTLIFRPSEPARYTVSIVSVEILPLEGRGNWKLCLDCD